MRLPAALVLLFFSAFISLAGQQTPAPTSPSAQPPRDVVPRSERPAPTGTGIIRGRVVAADTGNPMRRAMVNLSPMMPAAGDGRGAGGLQATAVLVVGSPGSGPSPQAVMARPRQATTDSQGSI